MQTSSVWAAAREARSELSKALAWRRLSVTLCNAASFWALSACSRMQRPSRSSQRAARAG